MGFWHTGYMEFHETTGEGAFRGLSPPPSKYPCKTCGFIFNSERDVEVHNFHGHSLRRPTLILRGRECGRTRLSVTRPSEPSDWVIVNAGEVTVNGDPVSARSASTYLSKQRHGVVEVELRNAYVAQRFEFEFALAQDHDLQLVDDALERLIEGRELSLRSIDDFIMRVKPARSATHYVSGIADYLYGVLAREGSPESEIKARGKVGYEGKYDQAVQLLGNFDRPPAEAICGIVAFHYNQFGRAMAKTRSERVAMVASRLRAIVQGDPWVRADLSDRAHESLDHVLSDYVIEEVLRWCAVPMDGSAIIEVEEMEEALHSQRPQDAFKLRLTLAEHYLAAGDGRMAMRHAEHLRHGRETSSWFESFRTRLQGACSP